MFQIENLGDDDEEQQEFSSADFVGEGLPPPVFFKPRELRNLGLIDEMESFSPIVDCKVE
jgi:hypothetical protein